jgi:hypothetical protein
MRGMNRRSFLAQSLAAAAAASSFQSRHSGRQARHRPRSLRRARHGLEGRAVHRLRRVVEARHDLPLRAHVFENFEDAYLKSLKEQADRLD